MDYTFNILLKIKNQIEQDKVKHTNYYWLLNYELTKGVIIIKTILSHDKVIFMGDSLWHKDKLNLYLHDLYLHYPIKIIFEVDYGVKIIIDEKRLRKNKIKKLLDL